MVDLESIMVAVCNLCQSIPQRTLRQPFNQTYLGDLWFMMDKNQVTGHSLETSSVLRFRVSNQFRVLVIKPHNKTPYELFQGKKPALSFMRPFGCPVTILNTIDHLGKARVETVPDKDYILLPLWTQDPPLSFSSKNSPGVGYKPLGEEEKNDIKDPRN
nr:ribonuclease H-like domain-containing protein [Tanacetum cinerariifolium]